MWAGSQIQPARTQVGSLAWKPIKFNLECELLVSVFLAPVFPIKPRKMLYA